MAARGSMAAIGLAFIKSYVNVKAVVTATFLKVRAIFLMRL